MLKSHIDAIEDTLVSLSKIPAGSGHPLHKGTPRESFIREYLQSHLPENFAIGTGEIIDCNSRPNEKRNQHDIIIYRKNFPKLNFGGGINAYLIESVIATIEVKSTLTESGVLQAIESANRIKHLGESFDPKMYPEDPNINDRVKPEQIKNYIIAYDGPDNIQTVHRWVVNSHEKLGIPKIFLPLGKIAKQMIMGNSIDSVFILHKGFLSFANQSTYFQGQIECDNEGTNHSWVMANQTNGNLLQLFMLLIDLSVDSKPQAFYPMGYLKHHKMGDIFVHI